MQIQKIVFAVAIAASFGGSAFAQKGVFIDRMPPPMAPPVELAPMMQPSTALTPPPPPVSVETAEPFCKTPHYELEAIYDPKNPSNTTYKKTLMCN